MKKAYYFGCLGDGRGHHLIEKNGKTHYDSPEDCPWNIALMDAKLLKNGKHRDIVDGKVFWTVGGKYPDDLWFAFFWWDRSGDARGNSNSGFYVKGFKLEEKQQAFEFACSEFPNIIKRQKYLLVIQEK